MKVTPRARGHEDRSGDPLDGMVNLFDLGIVLSVAFLLAALASLNLSGVLTGQTPVAPDSVVVQPGETLHDLPPGQGTSAGRGTEVGKVYRLEDGRLVYVTGTPSPAPSR